jgi:hypothetical protein
VGGRRSTDGDKCSVKHPSDGIGYKEDEERATPVEGGERKRRWSSVVLRVRQQPGGCGACRSLMAAGAACSGWRKKMTPWLGRLG